MRLALNMAKMAKAGFSRAAMEETHHLIKKPWAEVREEMKLGVESPGHKYVQAAIERHSAILRENQMDGCLPCQNGTAQNPEIRWRCKGLGAPTPERPRWHTPEPMPNPHGTPLMPHGDDERDQASDIEGEPPGYVYIHTLRPSAQSFNLDVYAKDLKPDKDFNADLLTDEGRSAG